MVWADEGRGLIDTIDGVIDPSESHSELGDINPPVPPPQPPTAPFRSEINLPPIPLPKFSGDPKLWAVFWKLFEKSVDRLPIDDFKKHLYLIDCLPDKSPARRAIELYPPSDQNYSRVVEILTKKFGDPKAIIESLQSELLHMAKPGESADSLRGFAESIERICRQLVDYGESEENKFMASTIKSKLPYNILTLVVERELKAGRDFTCLDLRRTIQSIVEVKEEVQRCTQVFKGEDKSKTHYNQSTTHGHNQKFTSHGYSKSNHSHRYQDRDNKKFTPNEYRSFPAINSSTNQPKKGVGPLKCSLREQMGHLPSNCPKYPSPEARRRRLVGQNRCLNCLKEGHSSEQCESFKRCLRCGEKHHTLVCLATSGPSQISKNQPKSHPSPN